MATSTSNLGLTLPSVNDAADIAVLNNNFQKIDEGCAPFGLTTGYYTASTDEQIDSAITASINAMGNRTQKIIVIYLDSSSNTLGGGTWFVTINKITADYATISAESYIADSYVRKYTRTRFGGAYRAWKREDSGSFAPSGYGLGTTAPVKDTFDYNGGNGFIDGTTGAMYNSSWCGINVASGKNGEHGYQELVDVLSYKGTKIRRYKLNGTWGEWAWVNPPMALGVEYRTTERHNGKPVYAKLLSVGNLPNASGKTIEGVVTSGFSELVELRYIVKNASGHTQYSYDRDIRMQLGTDGTFAWLGINTMTDLSGFTGTVLLKWTKP